MAEFGLSQQLSLIPSSELNWDLFQIQVCSLVSIDDIFSSLLTLTSYLTHKLVQFIEDVGVVKRCLEDSLISFHDDEVNDTHRGAFTCVPESFSTSSGYWNASRTLGGTENSYSELKDRIVYSRLGNVDSSYRLEGINVVLKGLVLPLFGLRLIRRLAYKCWSRIMCYLRCAQSRVLSFISRARRTLRGSADDIGWLLSDPEMAPTEDGSARFRELLQAIRNGEHELPDSFIYLLIPGLFSNHGPLYFVSTKKAFSKMGLACHIAKIHSEASVEHNAWELKQYIEELYWGSGKRVMLLGHSKGGVDAAAALVMYQKDLEGKVAGLAMVQSPYGGTPVAADMLREGQLADRQTRSIMEFIICKLVKGDMRALEDLTYEKRKEFIKKYKHPENIPLISFHSETGIAPEVLYTMSLVAHAELPWLPLPQFGGENSMDADQVRRQLPVIVPVSAVLAVCALHLQLRYGEKSDGLVTCRDAEVPGSVVVKPDRKLDHAWMVYSSWRKDPSEPDSCDMCEALLCMLVELGKTRKYQAGGVGQK
ncbi:OLC1v1037417C1 [Oldenlandia corymbosa var. corymbosa]|uniref:OLC1v1037417C1 n=1 Tax=Oldenlandia corymbosa var. corymbosa TaxID=529605 RepID=A0AAV1CY83_OLDCO|nr:OLC1v1037417C1 [Oldenlandia corymbosa var. corymbosa]